MTCRHCKWLDVTLDKLGRRRVRADSVHRCTAPPERVGDGCPSFKLYEPKRKETAS